ncbi:hypothetical protein L484_019873 [Morus notabilis]|uniref:Uncharacterized protein n=1 Tax=Morus notabilis TaxID=981085 RepID=W9S9Z0_9ROSA|nr:hypothetical protein L484_019873 [Morus notabilis]
MEMRGRLGTLAMKERTCRAEEEEEVTVTVFVAEKKPIWTSMSENVRRYRCLVNWCKKRVSSGEEELHWRRRRDRARREIG